MHGRPGTSQPIVCRYAHNCLLAEHRRALVLPADVCLPGLALQSHGSAKYLSSLANQGVWQSIHTSNA